MRVKKFKLENNISWFQNNAACLQSFKFLTYRETWARGKILSVWGLVNQVIKVARFYLPPD